MQSRESIYAAVFALFSGAADFKTTGRRLKTWDDVDKDRQPALFMAQGPEVATRTKGLPTKWTLNVKFYLYCMAPNEHSPVGPVINPLIDAIVGLVETGLPGETNTLGIEGVSHCWIEGAIETDEGALGSQGVAIIPLTILAS